MLEVLPLVLTVPSLVGGEAPRRFLWEDVDADGLRDALVIAPGGAARLLRNDGERGFEDATLASGLDLGGPLAAALWIDVDGDGRRDLFAASAEAGASRLWRNAGALRFEELAPLDRLRDSGVVGAQAVEIDDDGLPDLLVLTTDGEELFRNVGARFEPVHLPELVRPLVADAPGLLGTRERGLAPSDPPQPTTGSAPATTHPAARASSGSTAVAAGPAARVPLSRGEPASAASVDVLATGEVPVFPCASALRDQVTGACLGASSVPALGRLYPLGQELFIDSTGFVGIGTLSPTVSLDVIGGARVEGGLDLAGAAELRIADALQTPRRALTSAASNTLFVGSDPWDAVAVGPTGSLMATNGGEVGIGTATPVAPLHVEGTGLQAVRVAGGALVLAQSSSLAAEDSFQTPRSVATTLGTDDLHLGADTWETVRVGPSGSLVATNGGEVGIGTAAPVAPLHVEGTGVQAVRVAGGALVLAQSSSLAAEDSFQTPRSVATTLGTDDLHLGADTWETVRVGPTGSLVATNNGEVGIGTALPSVPLHVEGNGIHAVRVAQGRMVLADDARLDLEDASETPRSALATLGTSDLRVGADTWDSVVVGPTGTLVATSNGEIGVNTPTPAAPLHVTGNGIDAVRLEQGRLVLAADASLHAEGGFQVRSALATLGTDDLLVGSDTWDSVVLGSTGSFRVTQNGDVGIGTTNPTAPLEVHGNGVQALAVEQGPITLRSGAALQATDSFQTPRSAVASLGSDSLFLGSDDWQSVVVGPTGSLVVTQNGDVGIGTSTPTAPLEVTGNGAAALRVETGPLTLTSSSSLVVEDASQAPRSAVASAGSAELFLGADTWSSVHVGPVDNLEAHANGSVSIGTSDDANVLTVAQGSSTDPIADAWTTYSSRRWKEDVATIDDALHKVTALRGVTYSWRETGERDVGFIAEEVGEVLPEIVQYEANGVDARSVDYARITAVLVEAVKDQQRQIGALRTEVRALREGRMD